MYTVIGHCPKNDEQFPHHAGKNCNCENQRGVEMFRSYYFLTSFEMSHAFSNPVKYFVSGVEIFRFRHGNILFLVCKFCVSGVEMFSFSDDLTFFNLVFLWPGEIQFAHFWDLQKSKF